MPLRVPTTASLAEFGERVTGGYCHSVRVGYSSPKAPPWQIPHGIQFCFTTVAPLISEQCSGSSVTYPKLVVYRHVLPARRMKISSSYCFGVGAVHESLARQETIAAAAPLQSE